MKKLILTALAFSLFVTGCEKDSNLIQPDCEIITLVKEINGSNET